MQIRLRETFVTTNKDGEELAYPTGIRRVITWGNNPNPLLALLRRGCSVAGLGGSYPSFGDLG
jgi:hypothetical protein